MARLLRPLGFEESPVHPSVHVLIAEDDDDFRDLLTSVLRQDGYRVTAVGAGVPLLDALLSACRRGEDAPSLVISDERMPGIRGLQALHRARNHGMTLPMVLITAFGDEALIDRAAKIGVVVIRKPFEIDDLRIVARFLTAPARRASENASADRASEDEWKGESARASLRRTKGMDARASLSVPGVPKRDGGSEKA